MTRALSRAGARTYNLYEALREYEHWRLREADYSTRTWAGEKPGLLAFVDFMAQLDPPVMETREIAYEDVRGWWASLTVAESTRVTRLAQLRAFLGYCGKRGWLKKDPSLLLRAERPAAEPRDRLDAGELLTLTEVAASPRDRCLIALATNLALRGGEIARLTVGAVNLQLNEIKVRIEKTNEWDIMPITSDLAVELNRWLNHYLAVCDAVTPRSYLVPSQYTEPRHHRVSYRPDRPIAQPWTVVKGALSTIGWEETRGEGVHTVRRSVARIYFDMIEAEETFDSALLATMTLLHHQRSDTTLRYIGRDRASLARDRILKGKPFLTRLAERPAKLRVIARDGMGVDL